MRLRPTLFRHNNELYIILRAMPVEKFKNNMKIVKACKEWLDADHVLKYKGDFLFVEEIKELEILPV